MVGGIGRPSEMEGSEAATWAQRPAQWLSDSRILLKNQESALESLGAREAPVLQALPLEILSYPA